MDDLCYITLRCLYCEDDKCKYCPLGSYITYNNKSGCVREVDEDTAARFIHYTTEEIPFWKTQSYDYVKQSYQEIIDFLYQNIYNAKIKHLLNKFGKTDDKKLHVD